MNPPVICAIEYDIEPTSSGLFRDYARLWGQAIPACGANLIGYFSPYEGSLTKAYGLYAVDSLAAYERYKEKLRAHPIAQEAYALAQSEKFIRREDRTFLLPACGPLAAS